MLSLAWQSVSISISNYGGGLTKGMQYEEKDDDF